MNKKLRHTTPIALDPAFLRRHVNLAVAASLVLVQATASAIDWSGAISDDWSIGGNWVGGNVPGGTAIIDDGGIARIYNGTDATPTYIRLGNDAASTGNELTIDSGGTLATGSASDIGYNATGAGKVTVGGSWTATNSIRIGRDGSGELDVLTGAVVSSGEFSLGRLAAGSSGIATVRGTLNPTSLIVGYVGSGQMTVGAGGAVNVNAGAAVVTVARDSGSSGVLNIGGSVSGSTPGTAEAAGIINATGVNGGSGTSAALNFNHTGTDYYFTKTGLSGGAHVAVSGITALSTYSGTTSLIGANTYTGGTNVRGGTLIAANNTALGANAVSVTAGTLEIASTFSVGNAITVNGGTVLVDGTTTGAVSFGGSGGTLGGSGVISGAVALTSTNRVLSPGNSPGQLEFSSGQAWDSYTYLWEVNSWTSSDAGVNFDQIAITGALDLTGSSVDSIVLDIRSLTAGNLPGDVAGFNGESRDWTILTTTGGITGFDAANWSLMTGNFSSTPTLPSLWSVDQVGNNLVLSYSAIPEPGATALIFASALALLVWQIRRRKSEVV